MLRRKTLLRRSKPLKSNAPLRRTGFARRSAARVSGIIANTNGLKRTRLKKESSKGAKRRVSYSAVRKWYLGKHPECQICERRKQRQARASEVHHTRGRAGALLTDWRFFLSSCHECGQWVHDHGRLARELGVLASPVLWNVSEPDSADITIPNF